MTSRANTGDIAATALMVAGLILLVVRSAWVCDDAWITFRVIDNWLAGFGPNWNAAERVQAYSHPLWMLLLVGPYAASGTVFAPVLALSVVLSAGAALLVVRAGGGATGASLLGLALLLFSKSFVEFSTSGLENPLLHLLLGGFAVSWLCREPSRRGVGRLALLAALLAATRLETLLLTLPVLIAAAVQVGVRAAWRPLLVGLSPLWAWEAFALFYYGFPLPNPAYARLYAGVPRAEVLAQGGAYLLDALARDPLSLVAIASALAAPIFARGRRLAPLAIGLGLQLGFGLWMGGDAMSGRMLSAPLYASALVLTLAARGISPAALLAVLAAAGLLWLRAGAPALLGARPDPNSGDAGIHNGIADERARQARESALLAWRRRTAFPASSADAEAFLAMRDEPRTLVGGRPGEGGYAAGAGRFGFAAGPKAHLIDPRAFADALLARLPAARDLQWRPGRARRFLPRHYVESIDTGENLLDDERLAPLYDDIRLITRGPLFSGERLAALARVNLGFHRDAVDFDTYRYPWLERIPYQHASRYKVPGTDPGAPGVHRMDASGIEVELEGVRHEPRIEMSVDHDDHHTVAFYREGRELARVWVPARHEGSGLRMRTIEVPPQVAADGYDRIRIFPTGDDDRFALGHVRLEEPQPTSGAAAGAADPPASSD